MSNTAFRRAVVTGDGAAHNLAALLSDAQLDELGVKTASNMDRNAALGSFCLRAITFQANHANAAAIYISPEPNPSSADWMWQIPAASSGVPAPPLIWDHQPPVYLTDFYVLIASNEKLHIGVVLA